MNISPYPVAINGMKPIDGNLVTLPKYCKKKYKKECEKYYRETIKEGFLTCPFGYASYCFKHNDKNYIFTGLKISGYFNRVKIEARKNEGFNPKIDPRDFSEFVNKFRKSISREIRKYKHLTKLRQITAKERLFKNTLHEIIHLNSIIKSSSETCFGIMNREELQESRQEILNDYIQRIFAASNLMSGRISFYEFEENSLGFAGSDNNICVYKKFEKASHCLQSLFKKKNVVIEPFSGNSYGTISAHNVFDFLPFILLHNALKYSPEGSKVRASFNERSLNQLDVIILSKGPQITIEEKDKILRRGYRGENAIKSSETGEGIGLYFAKRICDWYSIKLSIKSLENSGFELDNIMYATTEVILNIPISGHCEP